jgi:hypothetical protein
MTNPEYQSTAHNAQEHILTLDKEQLEAVTGGGGAFSCCRSTRVTPDEPEPIVVIHPAPAPMGMEPHPNILGGLHIFEDHFSPGPSQASSSHHQPGPSHHR